MGDAQRLKPDGTYTSFKENIRDHNKVEYDLMVLKITNATTIQELNDITWNFARPNGVLIDVNDKAQQMLNDDRVDNITKNVINKWISKIFNS